MKGYRYCLLALLLLPVLGDAAAQDRDRDRRQASRTSQALIDSLRNNQVDVVLDVPVLKVEKITLEVDNLQAHLSLDARVANLVALSAGADVSINSVKLDIAGVEAEVHLRVDLDNVAFIVARTLETLENNPEIITTLGDVLQTTVGTVGDVAGQALGPGGAVTQTLGAVGQTLTNITRSGGLLSQTVNTLGQTVYQTLGVTGDIVETTLDATGNVVNSRAIGAVTDLSTVVKETAGTAGQTVRQVRDVGGNLIEYTVDTAGKVTNARVIERVQTFPERSNRRSNNQ